MTSDNGFEGRPLCCGVPMRNINLSADDSAEVWECVVMNHDGPTLSQENPDGSWSPGQPLGWQGGPDWEVYDNETPKRANLYDEDMLVAVVTARTRWGLTRKMRATRRRLVGSDRGEVVAR